MKWDWPEATGFIVALAVMAAGLVAFLSRGQRREYHPVDWRGLSVFVLALGVSAAVVAGFLAAELTNGPITSEEVGLISTLGGAAIGAVATYIGIHPGKEQQMETQETPEVEPEPAVEDAPAEPAETPPGVEPTGPTEADDEEQAEEITEGMGPGDGPVE